MSKIMDASHSYAKPAEAEECNKSYVTKDPLDFESVVLKNDKEQTCRLCANKCSNYESIFDDNNFFIAEKISRCLPIVVLSTDPLPLYVCKNCLNFLNVSYKLIITSLKADALLRQQYQESVLNGNSSTKNLISSRQESLHSGPVERSPKEMLRRLRKMAIHGPVTCEVCKYVFNDLVLFDNHMAQVHFQKWKCNLCDNSFQASIELIRHKEVSHGGNIIVCNNCAHEDESHELSDQSKIENDFEMVELKQEEKEEEEEMSFSAIATHLRQKVVESESFSCSVCNINVDEEEHLEAHKRIHKRRLLKCKICQNECYSVYEHFIHKQKVHNLYRRMSLKFVCKLCGKYFTNSWLWEQHEESVCPKKFSDNTCKYCNSTFSTHLKLTRHLRKHKKEMLDDPTVTVYKCVACPKIFVDKEFYEKHRNVHDPECWDKFKCELCNRSFRDNVRLKEHVESIHEGVKRHHCEVCGRKFHRLSNMKEHRKRHFGTECKECGKVFEKVRFLAKHLDEVHGLSVDERMQPRTKYVRGIYVCRYCGKTLATYYSLRDHEHIHTGEKPYSCPICDKKFRTYTCRWTHMRLHDEKGGFVCEHCGKCFNLKRNLTTHIQTHIPIEDRKHQCPKCSKRFLRKGHLTIHLRIHEGIRPYTCDICLFNFTQMGDMKRHRLRHMNGEARRKTSRIRHL